MISCVSAKALTPIQKILKTHSDYTTRFALAQYLHNKIDSLARRRLVDKRTTTRHSKSGRASTGNNHYHIRPFAAAQMAHERFSKPQGELGGTLTDEGDIEEITEV